ncbi:MAG: TetR/AcrR family transcriptional regulator [Planctomycetota bacterium]|nr:TetR/AcrR family transcriptional regulator [Planctomycetota bacterium]
MLHAAVKLFAKHGYEAVSVEEVSRAAGQSKGAFYWYFHEKEDCLQQALQSMLSEFEETMERLAMSSGSARRLLAEFVRLEGGPGAELFTLCGLVAHLRQSPSQSIRERVEEVGRQWSATFRKRIAELYLRAAREAGWSPEQIAASDFEEIALCYFAGLEGLVWHVQREEEAGRAPSENERAARTRQQLFIDAVLEHPPVRAAGEP